MNNRIYKNITGQFKTTLRGFFLLVVLLLLVAPNSTIAQENTSLYIQNEQLKSDSQITNLLEKIESLKEREGHLLTIKTTIEQSGNNLNFDCSGEKCVPCQPKTYVVTGPSAPIYEPTVTENIQCKPYSSYLDLSENGELVDSISPQAKELISAIVEAKATTDYVKAKALVTAEYSNVFLARFIAENEVDCILASTPGLNPDEAQSRYQSCKDKRVRIIEFREEMTEVLKDTFMHDIRSMIANTSCSINPFKFSLPGCAADLLGFLSQAFSAITAKLMNWSNALFGQAIGVSVELFSSFANMPAVMNFWKIARDISNLFFIFILLYIAIKTTLGISVSDSSKLLSRVIVVALLINFSAILPKVIIDIANIFALYFYNKIIALNGDLVTALIAQSDFSKFEDVFLLALIRDHSLGELKLITALTYLGAGTLFAIGAFVFFMGAIMFIYRSMALLGVIISSPVYFMSFAIPQKLDDFAKGWMKTLIGQAMMAPVMLFLIYLVTIFIVTEENSLKNQLVYGFGNNIAQTVIYFLIINLALAASYVAAKKVSESSASLVNNNGARFRRYISNAASFGVGAAAGTVGFAGRNTLGRAASRLAQSERFNQFAGRSRVGEYALRGVRSIGSDTFDIRGSDRIRRYGQRAGINLSQGTQGGGFEERLRRNIDERESFGRKLKTPIARQKFAERTARSPMARLGSGGNILSMFGRGNRMAAAQMIRTQINEVSQQINTLTNEQNSLNRMPAPLPAWATERLTDIDTELTLLNANRDALRTLLGPQPGTRAAGTLNLDDTLRNQY